MPLLKASTCFTIDVTTLENNRHSDHCLRRYCHWSQSCYSYRGDDRGFCKAAIIIITPEVMGDAKRLLQSYARLGTLSGGRSHSASTLSQASPSPYPHSIGFRSHRHSVPLVFSNMCV